MASRIEPDPKVKPPAAAKPSAAPRPTAAKPAARPAGPPPAAGKPGAAAAQQAAGEPNEEEHDGEGNVLAAGFLKNMPAWAISMLVHVVALLAMALMVTPPPEKEKIRVITSSAPEVNEDFQEFDQDQPLENTQQTDATTDMVVPTDVTAV